MNRDVIKYSDLPAFEQPLVRVNSKGAKSLNNIELLSIVLGIDEIDRANRIIFSLTNGIGDLQGLSCEELKDLGFTDKEVRSLLCSLELGKRLREAQLAMKRFRPGSMIDLAMFLQDVYADEKQEVFKAIYLKRNKSIIEVYEVGKGTSREVLVEPTDVLRRAIQKNAKYIVLSHNHPGGIPEASVADVETTLRITTAAKVLDIEIIDHFIVGENGKFSVMRDKFPEAFDPASYYFGKEAARVAENSTGNERGHVAAAPTIRQPKSKCTHSR
jgi:DNA repair protein RadC